MSRALEGGRKEDLADNSDLAVFATGAKLLASNMGINGLKGLGSDLLSSGPKSRNDDMGVCPT